MENTQKNIVKVTFNNGESFESTGSSSGIADNDLGEDLRWISYVLPGYINDREMTFKDVKNITISIDYTHNSVSRQLKLTPI